MKGIMFALIALSAVASWAEEFDRSDLRFQEGTLFAVTLNPGSRELTWQPPAPRCLRLSFTSLRISIVQPLGGNNANP